MIRARDENISKGVKLDILTKSDGTVSGGGVTTNSESVEIWGQMQYSHNKANK